MNIFDSMLLNMHSESRLEDYKFICKNQADYLYMYRLNNALCQKMYLFCFELEILLRNHIARVYQKTYNVDDFRAFLPKFYKQKTKKIQVDEYIADESKIIKKTIELDKRLEVEHLISYSNFDIDNINVFISRQSFGVWVKILEQDVNNICQLASYNIKSINSFRNRVMHFECIVKNLSKKNSIDGKLIDHTPFEIIYTNMVNLMIFICKINNTMPYKDYFLKNLKI